MFGKFFDASICYKSRTNNQANEFSVFTSMALSMVLPLASQAAGPCTEYKILNHNNMTRVNPNLEFTVLTSRYYCDDYVDTGEHSTKNNDNNNKM